jgi:hypothetical protein
MALKKGARADIIFRRARLNLNSDVQQSFVGRALGVKPFGQHTERDGTPCALQVSGLLANDFALSCVGTKKYKGVRREQA